MDHRAARPDDMIALGREAAARARAGDVIALTGGLGAGKTHWTKGFVEGIGATTEATSPTFGLVHEYHGGRLPVFHFDLYRLDGADELVELGWDEYLEAGGVVVVEWADRFPVLLPPETTWIAFSIAADGTRTVAEGAAPNEA